MLDRIRKYLTGRRSETSAEDEADLTAFRGRDPKSNAETTPAEDENIRLCAVWGVELFTPAHANSLVERLAAVSASRDSLEMAPYGGTKTWVEEARLRDYSGGWAEVGPLTRPDEKWPGYHALAVPLPDNVEYATLTLHSLAPALSCLVAGFVLRPDAQDGLEAALRQRRQTVRQPHGPGRYLFLGPDHQKQMDADELRRSHQRMVHDWFSANFPGLFCEPAFEGAIPTCELTTIKHAEPFLPSRSDYSANTEQWLSILGYTGWDSWRYPHKDLYFAPSLGYRGTLPFYGALVVRESEANSFVHSPKAGKLTAGQITGGLSFSANGLLSRWALLGLLDGYERHLGRLRDSIGIKRKEDASKALVALRESMAGIASMFSTTVELLAVCESDNRVFRNVPEFVSVDEPTADEPETIGSRLRDITIRRARRIKLLDESLRTYLTQYTNALAATESVAIQGTVKWLTWILIGLTLILLVLTGVVSLSETPLQPPPTPATPDDVSG